eukprot:6239073-Amphidinium_carterae.1
MAVSRLVGYTVAYTHYIHLAVMLVKLLCFIAWLSHAGACLWWEKIFTNIAGREESIKLIKPCTATVPELSACLLYTSDAADDTPCVDL